MTRQQQFAREFASSAHANLLYGGEPYVTHLDAVAAALREFGYADETALMTAAYLHDVLEDTGTSQDSIVGLFGLRVASLVLAVTGRGNNRAERNADIACKLMLCPSAIPLKLADQIANVRHSKNTDSRFYSMYRREYPIFRTALYMLLNHGYSDDRASMSCSCAISRGLTQLRLLNMWWALDGLMGWPGCADEGRP